IIQDYEKQIYDLTSENQFLKEQNHYFKEQSQFYINLYTNAYYHFGTAWNVFYENNEDFQYFEQEVVNYIEEVNDTKKNKVIEIDEENVKKEDTKVGSLKFDRQSIISLSDDNSIACNCIEYRGSCEDCFVKKFKSEYNSEDNFDYENYNEAYHNVFNDEEREYNKNYCTANMNNFYYESNDDGYEEFLQRREYNSMKVI
ncbi:17359_t:CDS:1, partial [Cetraspora pellucida]